MAKMYVSNAVFMAFESFLSYYESPFNQKALATVVIPYYKLRIYLTRPHKLEKTLGSVHY